MTESNRMQGLGCGQGGLDCSLGRARSAGEGSTVKRCFHQDQFYCLGTGAAISKGLQSDQQLKPCYTEITVGRNGRAAHGRSDHSLTHPDRPVEAADSAGGCQTAFDGSDSPEPSFPLAPAPSPGVL